MFKLEEIKLFSAENDDVYKYEFSSGINYIVGDNDTGKTIFYEFIDYIFGSSKEIFQNQALENTISKVEAVMSFNNQQFFMRRFSSNSVCSFCSIEDEAHDISLDEYTNRINNILIPNKMSSEFIKIITEQDLSFRTFTMFNFLGEKHQGYISNFLDKCNDVKYYTKLNDVLNFIFISNKFDLKLKKKKIDILSAKISEYEKNEKNNILVKNIINKNLDILDINHFNGKNKEKILKEIKIKQDLIVRKDKSKDNTVDLIVKYDALKEELKVFNKYDDDLQSYIKSNNTKINYISKLNELISESENYKYLVDPILQIIDESEKINSMYSHVNIKEQIVIIKSELKKLEKVIGKNNAKLSKKTIADKDVAIATVELLFDEYIDIKKETYDKDVIELKKLKKEFRDMQYAIDNLLKNNIENFAFKLYKSASKRKLVEFDFKDNNLCSFEYNKQGNSITLKHKKNNEIVTYQPGSLARYTLIQLCAYLSFLNLLVNDKVVPILPFFCIDHITKSFDDENKFALADIIKCFYENNSKDNFQIFIFDSEDNKNIGLEIDRKIIFEKNKNGFNPFYKYKK